MIATSRATVAAIGECKWWTSETSSGAQHRDHEDSGHEDPRLGGILVVPHARVPDGLWRQVIALIDGEQRWLSEHEFVNQAIKEKVAREIGKAIRRRAEQYGVSGSQVKFTTESGEDPYLG
jgi:hypothetical protein